MKEDYSSLEVIFILSCEMQPKRTFCLKFTFPPFAGKVQVLAPPKVLTFPKNKSPEREKRVFGVCLIYSPWRK